MGRKMNVDILYYIPLLFVIMYLLQFTPLKGCLAEKPERDYFLEDYYKKQRDRRIIVYKT
jgi:hypothetical protein